MDRLGEALRFLKIRLRGFAPDHVRVGSVDQTTRNCGFDATLESEESLAGALTGEEFNVANVAVSSHKLGAVGVGAGDQDCGHARDVGGETGRDQLGY